MNRILLLAGLAVLVIGGIALIMRHDAATDFANEDLAQIVSLTALLIVIGGSALAGARRPGALARGFAAAVSWALIGLVLVVLYTFRNDLSVVADRVIGTLVPGRATVTAQGEVVLHRGIDGHFHVAANANGGDVQMMIDTGATRTSLKSSDARRAGIDMASLNYTVPVSTANGRALMAPTTIDELSFGGVTLRGLGVLVAPEGALDVSLLGNNALNRFSSMSISGDRLVLTP
ncbi:MAG: TIGR02281 family clan AA aspartic protease [Flavobacteriaceae bacterium]